MGNVVRVGDSVDCGDHAAEGSSTVFMGGMPVVTQSKNSTTGHGCYPPTKFITGWSTTVFVNGEPVAIKGKTKIMQHCCGHSCHVGTAASGASSVSVEA